MVADANEPIKLTDGMVVELPDGSRVRLRPGPYGKGIAIIPLGGSRKATPGPRTPGQRGRRPRPGTTALREQLARDVKSGKLKDNQHYVKWVLSRDDGLSLAVARQIVYRERRKVAP